MDPEGLSGGIYVRWDAENIKFEVLTQTQQELHFPAQVSAGYPKLILSTIYASTSLLLTE